MTPKRNSIEDLNLPIVSQEPGIVKYQTKNARDLSVTFYINMVYIENDWIFQQEGTKPLYPNFIFGKTSLDDIRKELGTNGFT